MNYSQSIWHLAYDCIWKYIIGIAYQSWLIYATLQCDLQSSVNDNEYVFDFNADWFRRKHAPSEGEFAEASSKLQSFNFNFYWSFWDVYSALKNRTQLNAAKPSAALRSINPNIIFSFASHSPLRCQHATCQVICCFVCSIQLHDLLTLNRVYSDSRVTFIQSATLKQE